MTCPECRNEVVGLACVRCTTERNRRGARMQFPTYAEPIRLNPFAMLLRRRMKPPGAGVEHIALPQFQDAALCGANLRGLRFLRRALLRELPERLCPECQRALGDALGGGETGNAAAL